MVPHNYEKLNEIIEEHEKWLSSNGKCGKRADFRDAYLRKACLSFRDLRKADFRCADLRGTDFRLGDLRGADLRGANLYKTKIFDVDIRFAKFSQTILQDAASGMIYFVEMDIVQYRAWKGGAGGTLAEFAKHLREIVHSTSLVREENQQEEEYQYKSCLNAIETFKKIRG